MVCGCKVKLSSVSFFLPQAYEEGEAVHRLRSSGEASIREELAKFQAIGDLVGLDIKV